MEDSKDLENTTYSIHSEISLNETNTDNEYLNKKIVKILKNDKNKEVLNYIENIQCLEGIDDVDIEMEKNVNGKFKDNMNFLSKEFGITKNVPLNSVFKESKFQNDINKQTTNEDKKEENINNEIKEEEIRNKLQKEKEKKNEEQNNEKDKDKIEENNISEENIINNEIFVLLCIIISKNKLKWVAIV